MKALSLWQPWATLIVSGHKHIETRSWPAPHSVRGQRIAIASTKTIRSDQRRAAEEPAFQRNYAACGLPELETLPRGCVVGTVIVEGCREIDGDLLSLISEQEESFGLFEPGRFAWFLKEAIQFAEPIAADGRQGLWHFEEM